MTIPLIAQVTLAASFAFAAGTDIALHGGVIGALLALVAAIVAPRVDTHLRATHLSVAGSRRPGRIRSGAPGPGAGASGSRGEPGALRLPLLLASAIGSASVAPLVLFRGALRGVDPS